MRWVVRLVVAGALIALGVWVWWTFFPSPERAVRKVMAEVAHAASFPANEGPLAVAANSQRLASFFTTDNIIMVDVPGRARQTFGGRDELLQVAMHARPVLGSLKVEFLDTTVTVDPGRSSATVVLTLKAKAAVERDLVVQEMKFELKKIDGTWLINRVETVRTLL